METKYVIYQDTQREAPRKKISEPITYEKIRLYYTGKNKVIDNFLQPGLSEEIKCAFVYKTKNEAEKTLDFLKETLQFNVGFNYQIVSL